MKKLCLLITILSSCLMNMSIAHAAAPAITINSISAYAGQSIAVPVVIDATTVVNSFGFTLNYDPKLLTVTSVTGGSATPTATWSVFNNPSTPGTLLIGMFNASVGSGVSGTAQQIAIINFTVNAGVASLPSPNLTLSNIQFDALTTGIGVTNGNFTLNLLGDVDGDQKITLYSDAILVAKYSLGLTTLSASQLLSADTSKDGKVNIYDAALIAEFAAGVIKTF